MKKAITLADTLKICVFTMAKSQNVFPLTANPEVVCCGSVCKQLVDGVHGIVGRDIDADGAVSAIDFNLWAQRFGLSGIYNTTDADMDGNVSTSDVNKWVDNFWN
ncbi:MAG TPA: hypothetical protein VFC92_03495 [Bacteroidales bacterium]|nr:hypothetical protein [Bacteroidales bacterium]